MERAAVPGEFAGCTGRKSPFAINTIIVGFALTGCELSALLAPFRRKPDVSVWNCHVRFFLPTPRRRKHGGFRVFLHVSEDAKMYAMNNGVRPIAPVKRGPQVVMIPGGSLPPCPAVR